MRGSGLKASFAPEGEAITRADFLHPSLNGISPEYFDAMGMRILAGRGFLESDMGVKPLRVVVNQALATQLFPHSGTVVGKRIWNGLDRDEIIGVVNDAKYR